MGKGAAKLRLAIAAGLFLGWLGWLGYLVVTTHDPVIISRPQFIVADLWVRARVDGSEKPHSTAAIVEVLWAGDKEDKKLSGDISVWDLPFARKAQGWAGPGDYLLPLSKSREGKSISYHLTPLPPSPGYGTRMRTIRLNSDGKKKDAVAKLIVELAGLKADVAKAKVNRPGSAILKNIPLSEVQDIKEKFKDLNASVSVKEEESRIYRATPQALEQINEIHMKEK